MPNPVHKNGALSTTQAVLYKAPEGKYAVLIGLAFVNTSGANARDLTVLLRVRGDSSARMLGTSNLTAGTTSGNNWTLNNERYVLAEGDTVEAFEGAGTDIVWNLCALEYDTP